MSKFSGLWRTIDNNLFLYYYVPLGKISKYTSMMKIEEIKTGMLVIISSLIEGEIDGIKRRKGALGMVEAPVFGTCGMWWWIIHHDGAQIKYRYCEISEMKTIKLVKAEEGKENQEKMQEDAENIDTGDIIEDWIG